MSEGRGHHLKRLEQNSFLLSSENVADILHFLTLQNMHNMPNLSINIKKYFVPLRKSTEKNIVLLCCFQSSYK